MTGALQQEALPVVRIQRLRNMAGSECNCPSFLESQSRAWKPAGLFFVLLSKHSRARKLKNGNTCMQSRLPRPKVRPHDPLRCVRPYHSYSQPKTCPVERRDGVALKRMYRASAANRGRHPRMGFGRRHATRKISWHYTLRQCVSDRRLAAWQKGGVVAWLSTLTQRVRIT